MNYSNTTSLLPALIDKIIDREKINDPSLNLEQLTEDLNKTDYYTLKARLIKLNESNVTESHETPLESPVVVQSVDRDAMAKIQLEALGYVKGDKVFLRFFYPKWHPKYKDDKGAKSEFIFPAIPWASIDRLQSDGRGCYFVVNGQGQKDENVLKGKAVFYEHDDLPRELQLDLWTTLGLPVPTIQIDTGGKSIHSYWVLDQPIEIADWKTLQTDLLVFSKGDRSIKNASRVMRLAGALHIGEGGNNQTTIISNSGNRYNFDELRSVVPSQNVVTENVVTENSTRSKAPKPLRVATETVSIAVDSTNGSIPSLDEIRKALSHVSPDCCYGDWKDIGMALHSQDIKLLGEWDLWSSGSEDKPSEKYKGECAKKWQTFNASDGINIYKLFQIAKNQNTGYQAPRSSVTADEIRNYTPEEPTRFSWDSVREGFPADITEAYEKANSYRAIEADVVALTLITALSAELGGLCDTDSGSALNIWAVIVGVSGSGKSGKISAVTKGLSTINSDRLSLFKEENSQYKKELRTYETQRKELNPNEELEEPIEPTLNSTIIQSITGEKLLDVLQTQESKSRGLLGVYDEFKTFLGGIGKYNQGTDEESRYLTIQSGEHVQADTKTHGRVSIERPKLSVIGGIQPVVLMQHVGKTGKESGFWARLLLAKTCESKVVHRFDREASKAKFLQLIVEKYVSKIQQISGQLRSEMTEETIDLRFETGEYFLKELEVTTNRECVLKTIDYIDRVATVLSLLEYLYLGLSGDLAPVYPHHYRAALALCENSLSIWEELTHVDIEKDEAELVQKAYKIGLKKKKLDAKSLQNWVKGEKAQNIIKLVYEAYGGTLTTNRSNAYFWTP